MIRIGLLGAAAIAPHAIIDPCKSRADARAYAIAARDQRRARDFAAQHALPIVAASYSELIARPDIDLIYNALPVSEHARWTIAALQAGKAVLCEKPLAANAADVDSMFAASASANQPLWEALHYRHHPNMQELQRWWREGALGAPRKIIARLHQNIERHEHEIRWRAELGGGALWDLGVYLVHVLRFLQGDDWTVVDASAQYARGVDAATSAQLRHSSGVEAVISCSMIDPNYDCSLQLVGSTGQLRFDSYVAPQWGGRLTITRDGVSRECPLNLRPTFAWQLNFVLPKIHAPPDPAEAADSTANMRLMEAIARRAKRQ